MFVTPVVVAPVDGPVTGLLAGPRWEGGGGRMISATVPRTSAPPTMMNAAIVPFVTRTAAFNPIARGR